MKIASIASCISRASGGVGPVVRELHRQFVLRGVEDMVFTKRMPGNDEPGLPEREIRTFSRIGPGAWGYAAGWKDSVQNFQPDLIHSHGLWQYSSLMAYQCAEELRIPAVISPHGMLDGYALRIGGWKKRIIRRLFEDRHLNRAACIHALCHAEFDAVRNCGITVPVAIIPNGVDLPELSGKKPESQRKHLLFLGRITPKKGVAELLRTWEILCRGNSAAMADWQLDIVGWGDCKFVASMKRFVMETGIGASVIFHGPAFDGDKARFYRNADGFILPSFSEGLPMAVLEAWSYGIPVLMTEQCNLPEGFAQDAAVRLELSEERLAPLLLDFFALSAEVRRRMGRNGRILVEHQFCWKRIGEQMLEVYCWCLGTGPRPRQVRCGEEK